MRAVMRRVHGTGRRDQRQDVLQAGDVVVDFAQRRVTFKAAALRLTPTEYTLLEELVTHADQVFSRSELLASVWGDEYRDDPDYLRVSMGRLRRKLEDDPANPTRLLSEPGVGYRFKLN